MSNASDKTINVIFELPDRRTHTHRGVTYRNGDAAEFTEDELKRLQAKMKGRKGTVKAATGKAADSKAKSDDEAKS
ncbi:MAG: hypothetical protein ACOC8P_00535 [Dichotomicrobium sp.]